MTFDHRKYQGTVTGRLVLNYPIQSQRAEKLMDTLVGVDYSEIEKRALAMYERLPVYLQHAVDEDPDSGLEPEELPDGWDRLGIKDV